MHTMLRLRDVLKENGHTLLLVYIYYFEQFIQSVFLSLLHVHLKLLLTRLKPNMSPHAHNQLWFSIMEGRCKRHQHVLGQCVCERETGQPKS